MIFQTHVFFIDFEKAYETIEWDFIHECLGYFQFGTDFKEMDVWFS